MKTGRIFCLLLFYTSVLHAQNDSLYKRTLCLSPGVSWQGRYYGEINLMYLWIENTCAGNFFDGPRIGVEMYPDPDHFVFAPKIGYELTGIIYTFRGNALAYIDKGNLDLRLLPEVGVSLLGCMSLTYGCNIPLLGFRSEVVSRNRFTLTVNLNRELWAYFL